MGRLEASDKEQSQVGSYSSALTRASSTVTELVPSNPRMEEHFPCSPNHPQKTLFTPGFGQSCCLAEELHLPLSLRCPVREEEDKSKMAVLYTYHLCSHGTLHSKWCLAGHHSWSSCWDRDQALTLLQSQWKFEDSRNTILSTYPSMYQRVTQLALPVPSHNSNLGTQSRR